MATHKVNELDWFVFMETALLKEAEWWGMKEAQRRLISRAIDSGLPAFSEMAREIVHDPDEGVLRMWKAPSN